MSASVYSRCFGHVLGNAWSYRVSAGVWSLWEPFFSLTYHSDTPVFSSLCDEVSSFSWESFFLNLLFSFLEESTQSAACMCTRDNHSKIQSAVLFARVDKNGWVLCETADWLIIHDPSRLFTQWETNTGSFVLFWVLLANLFDLAVCK